MAQIMKVDSQLSINGLLGLQSNLAEGVWKEKVGKTQKGWKYTMPETLAFLLFRFLCLF